jgi:hypothetical protein
MPDARRVAVERGVALERAAAEQLVALRAIPDTTPPHERAARASAVRSLLDEAVDCFDRARHDDTGNDDAHPAAHLRYAAGLVERTSFDSSIFRVGSLVAEPARAALAVRSSLLDALHAACEAVTVAGDLAAEAVGVDAMPEEQLADRPSRSRTAPRRRLRGRATPR